MREGSRSRKEKGEGSSTKMQDLAQVGAKGRCS